MSGLFQGVRGAIQPVAHAWSPPKPSDGAPVPSARPVAAKEVARVSESAQKQPQASVERHWPQSAREKPSAKQVDDVRVSRPYSAREREEQVSLSRIFF